MRDRNNLIEMFNTDAAQREAMRVRIAALEEERDALKESLRRALDGNQTARYVLDGKR